MWDTDAVHAPAEQWLDRPLDADPSIETLMLRYLAAFGPATDQRREHVVGLTRLGEVFDRLRPQLRTFADEQGRELFDLPDAPRPDAGVPAPVRFLYDFDNLLLSHADRTRVLDPAQRKLLQPTMNLLRGAVLIDGFVGAGWRAESSRKTATLTVTYASKPTKKLVAEVEREGRRLLEFLSPEAERKEIITGE